MPVVKRDLIPLKTKRRSGRRMPRIGFIVAHDTGNFNSTAQENVNYYKRTANEISASAHFFVDDKGIIECVPGLYNAEKAWHVLYNRPQDNAIFGDDANDIAIGVELCFGNKFNSMAAYLNYVWLLAHLCVIYDLSPKNDIVGHYTLDPKNRTDPKNALSYIGKTFNDLINDVVKEHDFMKKRNYIKTSDGCKFNVYHYKDEQYIKLDDIQSRLGDFEIFDYESTIKPQTTERRVLKPGMSGKDVRELEHILTKIGYDIGKYEDDFYGSVTQKKVMAFQTDYNLKVDGIVGPITWSEIDRVHESVLSLDKNNADNARYVVAVDTLNVRDDRFGKIYGQLHKGDEVKRLKIHESGDWFLVENEHIHGFVAAEYLRPVE